MKIARIGIIGGGLMGREIASAFARWCAFTNATVSPRLTAVADLNPNALEWFSQIPSCSLRSTNPAELLADRKSVV